jgi:uncharacterized protein
MDKLPRELEKKYHELNHILKGYHKLLVAYSGGVDSVFLLKTASDVLGNNSLGVIGDSPSLARRELSEAVDIAQKFNLPYVIIKTHELEDENYASNPENRCYFCKKELFNEIYDYAKEKDFTYIADGTNADDAVDFRPGKKAAQELKVVSPLQQAGFTKKDVRDLSQFLGLPTWNKPALACLSSRLPTGTRVTSAALKQVEQAEEYLYALGFKILRVRHHDNLARIEVGPEEINNFFDEVLRKKIDKRFREIGYKFVTLDISGYRMGSLNQLIASTNTKHSPNN